jgi:hypothetical protein
MQKFFTKTEEKYQEGRLSFKLKNAGILYGTALPFRM